VRRLSSGSAPVAAHNGYDDGRRTRMERQQVRSGWTTYLWDREQVLMELNKTGTTTVRYTQAPRGHGDVISQRRSSASTFWHFDAIGSMRFLTAADQSKAINYVYDAFGITRSVSGTTTNRFRYIGKLGYYLEPALGCYYLRRRYYVHWLGRFLSKDPLRQGGENAYGYVNNRPTTATDASGRRPIGWPDPNEPTTPPQTPQPPCPGKIEGKYEARCWFSYLFVKAKPAFGVGPPFGRGDPDRPPNEQLTAAWCTFAKFKTTEVKGWEWCRINRTVMYCGKPTTMPGLWWSRTFRKLYTKSLGEDTLLVGPRSAYDLTSPPDAYTPPGSPRSQADDLCSQWCSYHTAQSMRTGGGCTPNVPGAD